MLNFRNIVLVSGVAVVVTVAILIAVIQWFNWDRYRGDAARWIGSVTARPVSIDGPIDVKLFPSPRLYLAGISIGNPEGDFTGQFFHVESAFARLNLTALFAGKLVLDELRLFVDDKSPLEWVAETESPLTGPAGNKEFLVLLNR